MQIIVDSREPDVMVELFAEAGFEVYIEQLPTGDCLVLGPDDVPVMCFTLKSNNDMLESIYSNHLHNEIFDMLGLDPKIFIGMVLWNEKYIGCRKGSRSRGKFVKARVAERVEKINSFYLPIFKVKDRDGAVAVIKKWAERLYDGKIEFPVQYRRKVELVGDKKMDYNRRLFLSLPGIGEGNVDAIMAKYDTIPELIRDIAFSGEYRKYEFDTKKRWREMFLWYRDIPLGDKSAERIFEIFFGHPPRHD